ncbi:MAG TPA: chemotaxis protein CheA [Spirochaetota bacterium]|nr:chemotaxis protein CheA [Spirochaetota bacterium]HPJ33819.1 chemotaxis protein CheA [Spirochaetota bacterium]
MGEGGLTEVFLNESKEIIGNLESDIVTLEERNDDQEIINRIFRYFHTLKGSSGIAGFTVIYEFTHNLESLFDKVRSGEMKVNRNIIDILLDSIDYIKEELFGNADPDHSGKIRAELTESINSFLGKNEEKEETEDFMDAVGAYKGVGSNERFFRIRAAFREDIFSNGIDPLMVIEDLSGLGDFTYLAVDEKRIPDFNRLDPEKCYMAWDIILKTQFDEMKIRDVFLFVYDDNEIDIENVTDKYSSAKGNLFLEEKKLGEILVEKGIINDNELEDLVRLQNDKNYKLGDIIVQKGLASSKQVDDALNEQDRLKKKIEISTVRVDSTKLDNLMNLLGEIVIGQASLHRIADEIEEEKAFILKNSLYGLDRVTREFQEQIMSIRMVPIGPTFEQFKRFVRDAAHSMGKEIKLRVEGGDTELDKTVIEKIGDPLKHMIRNALDHGIETADERKKAGKPPYGTVTLKAYHQEGNVYIDIIDDGRGVNLEKIKKKAVTLGLLSPEEEITKEKLISIIFSPGFSTTEQTSDLSGRGVGMDVVKTNIEELRGSVEIRTKDKEGTLIRIKLPLTLAIIEGMLVRIGRSILIIPLLSVIETIQVKKEDYKTVEGKGEVILVRGEYLSLVRLNELFGMEANFTNPWEALIVIVESGGERIGIMIDDLIGQQQIVIKSLDNYISTSRSISGATILGDGKVALILDIHGMAEEIKNK